ncbi:CBS domain-containing protein [Pararhizobium sp.]|uniref:CBS domain-containing protein n=1 Tax=Pararhizobium sp. TaxID=1977563 RepID=UPI00271CC426|nr:CBS domain-containing protein [Pararhizobium sp.]MDO9416367.1 CBS domain-containing protein [Pararhizobium sp.]
MRIADIMTRTVHMAEPDETLQEVARRMVDKDLGFLPVSENGALIGAVTDRDIVVRAVAEGTEHTASVRSIMSSDVKYCFEDDAVDDVIRSMGDAQVRRLPVVDRERRLIGVVSLADAARQNPLAAGTGLQGVVEPGGARSQTSEQPPPRSDW